MTKAEAKDKAHNNAESAESTGTLPAGFEPLHLERFFPYRLSTLSLSVSRSLANLYTRRFRLSVPEWRVMAVLGAEQPLSGNDVCRRTSMDKVQVSRVLTRMLSAGLVIRHRDEHDRRRSVLWLSEKGVAIYQAIVPLARAHEASILDALSPEERRQLDNLLRKLSTQAATVQRGA